MVNLSRVGLGGVFLGGFRSPAKLAKFLSLAQDLGVTFVDIAPLYFRERSEEMFAKSGQSSCMDVVLKCGVAYDGMRSFTGDFFESAKHATVPYKQWARWFPPESLAFYLKQSLARVRKSEAESFLLHSPPSNLSLTEYGEALVQLKTEGLCRSVGFSSDVERCTTETWADVVQLPFQFARSKTAASEQKLVLNGVVRESGFRLDEAAALARDLPPSTSYLIGTGKESHLREFIEVFGGNL